MPTDPWELKNPDFDPIELRKIYLQAKSLLSKIRNLSIEEGKVNLELLNAAYAMESAALKVYANSQD